MENSITVQQRIEELLKQRSRSKYKLAKEAGFYPATVYDWFNDKGYTPDRNSIESICLAFGIIQSEFYSGVDGGNLDTEQTRCSSCLQKSLRISEISFSIF